MRPSRNCILWPVWRDTLWSINNSCDIWVHFALVTLFLSFKLHGYQRWPTSHIFEWLKERIPAKLDYKAPKMGPSDDKQSSCGGDMNFRVEEPDPAPYNCTGADPPVWELNPQDILSLFQQLQSGQVWLLLKMSSPKFLFCLLPVSSHDSFTCMMFSSA
jgi:hypothetical protein